MRDFAQRVGGGEARKLPILDPLQQVAARRSPDGVGLEVIGQRIGIDEHDIPVGPGEFGEFIIRSDTPWTVNIGYLGGGLGDQGAMQPADLKLDGIPEIEIYGTGVEKHDEEKSIYRLTEVYSA